MTSRDVDRAKDTQEPAYSESDVVRQFQTLVENIPGLVAYMDIVQPADPGHSIPVYISPQIEQLLGYPHAAWMTDDELWLDVVHPEDAERMIAADAEARRTLSQLFAEYRMRHRDGRVVWVSEKAAVVEDPLTGTLYWQGVMVDITDRKRAEEAALASEHQFRSIFDAAAIGVMTLGLDGRILEANGTLERVGDYAAGALTGTPLADYLERGDSASTIQFEELAAGERERCELEHPFRRSDRSLMWCRTVMALVRDGTGRPTHVTAMLEDITDRKRAEADLVHRTLHDALTDLPNRQLFVDRLQQALARRGDDDSGVAVVFLDIDNFKEVNDSLGHHAGDDLILAIARRLTAAVRPSDTVARFAGDEFLVLTDDVQSRADATHLAARLMACLQSPFSIAGETVRVSASLGVVFSSKRGEASEDILRQADVAMYAAKARGRDCFSVFEPSLHSAAFARLDQRAELQRALDENQFSVYYQPIVELESGRIVGMEALLRWIHPDRGVVPPNEFVPLAEDSGLIVPIGRWVLRTACQQASAWRRDDGALGRDCYVSVNVASKQLQQAAFVDEVRCALEESGLPAGALMLEVTESSLVDDTDDGNIDRLRRLHELGTRLAIDDFGTGYSAFNYLRRFPMDVIKIDRSWVRGVAGGSQDAALVEGIISMAASLDLAVVAEGIEEDEQLAALRALDCAAGQGYLFAKPADAETATELLRRPGGAARRAA